MLVPPHGKFKVNAGDCECDGGMMFLASFDIELPEVTIFGKEGDAEANASDS